MDTSQNLSTLKSLLDVVKNWKIAGEKFGPDSEQSRQCGSKALLMLCRHVKILDVFQRLGTSIGTTGIIAGLMDLAEHFSGDEISRYGGENRYYAIFQQWKGFIPDMERWIEQEEGDLISSLIAIAEYSTSRSSLKRDIKKGLLKSYRKPGASSNSKHFFRRANLDKLYQKRQSVHK
ncbi:MAG: hypothetical protein WC374_06800 [Phycisphaerae bacterium]|jgi:hypothetical protein